MNAPVNPVFLTKPEALRDLMLSVAEVVRNEAATAARGDVESMRMGGRHGEANTRESARGAVMRIDVAQLVDEVTRAAPNADEIAAFEAAANANHTNILRNGSGEFVHPATQRAHAIWKLAVRWARSQQDRPP